MHRFLKKKNMFVEMCLTDMFVHVCDSIQRCVCIVIEHFLRREYQIGLIDFFLVRNSPALLVFNVIRTAVYC